MLGMHQEKITNENVGPICENTITVSLRLTAFQLECIYQTLPIDGTTLHLLYRHTNVVPQNVLPMKMTT